jgi:hypothetical protein
MSLESIQDRYGVPAYPGRRVRYKRRLGSIVGADDQYIRVVLDGQERARLYHPLWCIDYLDGVDHGRRYDERVEAMFPTVGAEEQA